MPEIFTTIGTLDKTDVRQTEVATGLWSPNDTGSLSAIYSSSVQIGISGEFYYDMYHLPEANTEKEVQFSVAYGHVSGGGSPTLQNRPSSTIPTQVIYSQYKNILLTSGSKFRFGTATVPVDSDDIYVINIARARVKQYLDPGNWQLSLSGSNGIFTFIDNSSFGVATGQDVIAAVSYDIRSGSINGGLHNSSTIFGKVFPDYGVIILDPKAISASVGFVNPTPNGRATTPFPFAPYTGSDDTKYQFNHEGLVRSISGAMARGNPFMARSIEIVTSNNYFITLNQNSYNYTNNPSYYTLNGSQQRVVREAFENEPVTYPTTIGLYNSANELLAVAKLSRPVQKAPDKRLTVRVRLDY
jgi:hypothetical protein